ncbi:MAG: type II toxin-antitoxin system RelE/ParE family toxin [Pirellulaceae bacterium]
MNRRIIVQPEATEDAKGIFTYLAKNSFAVARRFNEAAADTLLQIQTDPSNSIRWMSPKTRLQDLRWKKIRGFKRYLIFFRATDDCVEVVRILDGSRDVETLLAS